MEIEADLFNRSSAVVTFDSLEERVEFGSHAPFLSSMEHMRFVSYTTRGWPPWGPIFGYYGDKEFPQRATIPHGVVSHVAGKLALLGPNRFPETQEVQETIFATTLDYLKERRAKAGS
jgi:hypothetical protein